MTQSSLGLYLKAKRIVEFVFALFLLIVFSPVMGFCAVLLKLEDPAGPVIFSQERLGKNCKIFKVFKFRSMKVDQYLKERKLTDAERLLKVGSMLRKLSLDELPQLINILRGEMSFIGPRPLPVVYYPFYSKNELRRHKVLPGISGWAQVNGRNLLSWDDKLMFDIEYIDNVCLKMDLSIFFLTLIRVLKKSDVGVRGIDFPDVSLHEIRNRQREPLA